MTQHAIDLLPDAIRARSQAGIVAGRYVVSLLLAVVLLGLAATHSRLMVDLARQRLRVAEDHADIVLSAEAKATQLRETLNATSEFIRRYELIALPIEISRVMASLVNVLPESAALDRLDIKAGTPQGIRSARGRGKRKADGPARRLLTGEINGFALTDQEVAELVARIEEIGFFDEVSLDFSRSRTVRGLKARGFRISFRADLDVNFEVTDVQEAAHVQ
ncbi:MAG: PilN domain-containing protein [Vicinamibacterales bacterium]